MKVRWIIPILTSVSLVVCGALIWAVYWFRWKATGFLDKTLWDWLQLLIVPVILAGGGLAFTWKSTRTERHIAEKRYEQDQELAQRRYEQDQQIALDKQREDLLQIYLDRMSELLIEKQLRSSQSDDDVCNVAQARTMSILIRLDATRVGYVFSFLRQAGLLKSPQRTVNLSQANLPNVDWTGVDIGEVDLSGANFRGAILRRANLRGATLCNILFWGSDLWGADFSAADLRGAILWEAKLRGVNFSRANLCGVNLGKYQLHQTDLAQVLFYTTNPTRFVSGSSKLDSEATAAALSGIRSRGATANDTPFGRACLQGGATQSINIVLDDVGNSFLAGPTFEGTLFIGANLSKTNLTETNLGWSDLSEANLSEANLSKANLEAAYLDGANLQGADLRRACLRGASLQGANLQGADLREAEMTFPRLDTFPLNEGKISFSSPLDRMYNLNGTDLRGVKGLTPEQLLNCKARGAIIDEPQTISPPLGEPTDLDPGVATST